MRVANMCKLFIFRICYPLEEKKIPNFSLFENFSSKTPFMSLLKKVFRNFTCLYHSELCDIGKVSCIQCSMVWGRLEPISANDLGGEEEGGKGKTRGKHPSWIQDYYNSISQVQMYYTQLYIVQLKLYLHLCMAESVKWYHKNHVVVNLHIFLFKDFPSLPKQILNVCPFSVLSHPFLLLKGWQMAPIKSVFEIISKSHYQGQKRTQRLFCSIFWQNVTWFFQYFWIS